MGGSVKRVKFESSGNWTPIDMRSVYKSMEESRKRDEERKRIERENEENRINNIQCPLCKSTDKIKHFKRESNGIMGPGFESRITDEYLICKSCGVHYSDINKMK